MGIDIHTSWKGQTEEERRRQSMAWLSAWAGEDGYLREAYHGEPYATRFLCREAFVTGEARIAASVLRERLPHTLVLVEERARTLYHATNEEIETDKQSFRDFVALCERKESETGEPVLVVASY